MSENKIEVALEKGLFFSRWVMTPFYVGLLLAILMVLVKFVQQLSYMTVNVVTMKESQIIIGVLKLVDMALVANLMLIVAYVGYDHFVSKLGSPQHKDHPSWLDKIGYSGLKIRVMGSIAAITAIQLLRVFMDPTQYREDTIKWMLVIHGGVGLSGVLLAVMDKIAHSAKEI